MSEVNLSAPLRNRTAPLETLLFARSSLVLGLPDLRVVMVKCSSGGCYSDNVYLGVVMVIMFIWGLSGCRGYGA